MSLRSAVAVVVSLLSVNAFAQEATSSAQRPEGTTVGVGAGWAFPQSILEPNTVSVRVKTGRLTFEPLLNLSGRVGSASSNSSLDMGSVNTTTEDEDTTNGLNLSLNANIRYSVASAGPVDFVAIGGVGVGYAQSGVDSDVLDEYRTDVRTTTGFSTSLNWGLGVEWFLNRHIALSADATNPLVMLSQSTQNRDTTDTSGLEPVKTHTENITSEVNAGLIFQPSVRVMFHLYF